MAIESDPDQLRAEELVPTGGSWGGLLLDNPNPGVPRRLTWTFDFDFEEIERDCGATPVSATVDDVPLPRARWQHMSGQRIEGRTFAEPIESSMYFFMHHRFDAVELALVEQRGDRHQWTAPDRTRRGPVGVHTRGRRLIGG